MEKNYGRVKIACYSVNISMAVVANLSPLLFITFRNLYGISYSLLGLLVLINFVTQLTIDLIFSFFSHKFNIPKTVKITPYLTVAGLAIYALSPFLFPNAVYLGLAIGTVIFSVSGGLSEVLISPVIAALPSENPERDMSKLHSVYAWGVVGVIVLGTLFLLLFKSENWQWLALLLTLIPLASCVLFSGTKIPKMETPEKVSGALKMLKKKELWLCVLAIFLGGASECTMSQWSSSYLEQALGIEKVWGDIFGVALFALMLGLGRSLYAKYGKNIEKILFLGAIGATVCYLIAAVSSVAMFGLIACALTGLCVSMLWPGSLIVATDRIPSGGVFIFAMMAAGGDFGASVGPQLVGVIADAVSANAGLAGLAQTLGVTMEQLGMKAGMLVGMLFPLLAVFVYLYILRSKKKNRLLTAEKRARVCMFLGSSVTYGSATGGRSFVEELSDRYGYVCVKEAVSGTTLTDDGPSSYAQRMKNGLDKSAKVDCLVVQLSTNDITQNKPLGTISQDKDIDAFDTATVLGAMEYIVAYAKQTWGCAVCFYTNPNYHNVRYEALIEALYKIREKWGIGVLDFYHYAEMQALDEETLASYMSDPIHPNAQGYAWMSKVFNDYLQAEYFA